MQVVLVAVGANLLAQYASAPPESTTGAYGTTIEFERWCGLLQDSMGWRAPPGGGKHESGSALDLNYATNPYIATRSGQTYTGEATKKGTYSSVAADGSKASRSGRLAPRPRWSDPLRRERIVWR
jgi:hypothetical protein